MKVCLIRLPVSRSAGWLIVGKVVVRLSDQVRSPRPQQEWIITEASHLAIVEDDLWLRVQARVAANARGEAPNRGGRPPKYLLSSLARCGKCGGPIAVNNGKSTQTPIKVYLCQYHRTRGDEVCASSLRRPMSNVDRAVIDYLARTCSPKTSSPTP
jgi:hypothetical protein